MEALSADDTLSALFLDAAPADVRARLGADDTLEATLSALMATARAEWPEITLRDELFMRHLAARLADADPLDLAKLHVADLYLACACGYGDPAALKAFEERCFPELSHAVAREPKLCASLDDIQQHVRERLFVNRGGRSPRINEFNGRASLRTWFRVIAVRTLINFGTRGAREEPLSDELTALPLIASDPELRYMKELYRTAFVDAFDRTVQALNPAVRNLLRYSMVDHLSIDQIALLFSVHRATAARWLADAREALLTGIRERLIERLKVDSHELDSILRLIRSRVEISIDRAFSATPT
jgi:RNA polymerase sigma-70 factor (ECF subfamily)